MVFFSATCISFWMTIVNFQRAAINTANNVSQESISDVPILSHQKLVYNKLAQTINNTNIGSLGPSGTPRRKFRYYDSLFYNALQYGANARTSIEVGCASDPFLKYLDWIDKRTCVAPYFVKYDKVKGGGKNTNAQLSTASDIEKVTADFMDYKLPNNEKYDLLLCSQVLEHVPDPKSFMKKLIKTAKVSIISVPFNWRDCGKQCNHVTNYITQEMLLEWSYPYTPIYSGVVAENPKGSMDRRIIVVFINDEDLDEEEKTVMMNDDEE